MRAFAPEVADFAPLRYSRPMHPGFSPRLAFVEASKTPYASLFLTTVADFETLDLSSQHRAELRTLQFAPRPGALALLGSGDSALSAIFVVERYDRAFDYGALPSRLPRGSYRIASSHDGAIQTAIALGWALGSYRFDRYKKASGGETRLVWPRDAERAKVLRLAEGICLARDLVNTPAADMGPAELADAAKALAKRHGAKFAVIEGDALLSKNYPMIHAVGRASSRAPRLIDLRAGTSGPLVTLVGKGVCFDTGGLDLKPAAFMKLMKKDMGGAALVLGLAHSLLERKLPVRLRVLVPAVENSVSGNAMRPLDVLPTRKGLTVEIGDTDAEGRLVLADAITEAISEKPDLLIDAATLTGAARVALGTQMPAIFASRTSTWQALELSSERAWDPLWRLPLFAGYRSKLDSSIADLNNVGSDTYGGAITAALFLQEFVGPAQDWIHMDTMGYNLDARPGRPVGGEALGLLALDEFLGQRYGAASSKAHEARTNARKTPRSATEKAVPTKPRRPSRKASGSR